MESAPTCPNKVKTFAVACVNGNHLLAVVVDLVAPRNRREFGDKGHNLAEWSHRMHSLSWDVSHGKSPATYIC